MKLIILSIGKNKEAWLNEAFSLYAGRLKGKVDIEFRIVKNDEALVREARKEPAAVCLDPRGLLLDSEAFCDYFHKKIVEGGSRAAFVIGGAEGLPRALKQGFDLISLSPLTFTHQISRLILIEQVYRAVEIAKGSGYHKF